MHKVVLTIPNFVTLIFEIYSSVMEQKTNRFCKLSKELSTLIMQLSSSAAWPRGKSNNRWKNATEPLNRTAYPADVPVRQDWSHCVSICFVEKTQNSKNSQTEHASIQRGFQDMSIDWVPPGLDEPDPCPVRPVQPPPLPPAPDTK